MGSPAVLTVDIAHLELRRKLTRRDAELSIDVGRVLKANSASMIRKDWCHFRMDRLIQPHLNIGTKWKMN